jgi:hypothetical protein
MTGRVKLVLLSVCLLAVTFGVIDTQAVSRHSHRLVIRYFADQVFLPPANDPATAGVAAGRANCPRGYRATGGGYQADHILDSVPYADLFTRSYRVIVANGVNEAGTVIVTVACARGRTTRVRTSDAGAGSFRSLVERYRREVRAAR